MVFVTQAKKKKRGAPLGRTVDKPAQKIKSHLTTRDHKMIGNKSSKDGQLEICG